MTPAFALPLVVAVTAAALASLLRSRLHPAVAARCLALAAVAVASGWIWVLMALSLGALGEFHPVHRWFAWCPELHLGAPASAAVGTGAAVMLAWSGQRFTRMWRRQRRQHRRRPDCGPDGVLILPAAEPTAFAVPGRRGGVVVSAGMIEALTPREQEVLWAHERAHLHHHHHWYLHMADAATAAAPGIGRLCSHVRIATERWADEDAATAVGGDRHLVARAIAHAALAGADHRNVELALADEGVTGRVAALVGHNHRGFDPAIGIAVATLVGAVTVGGSTLQLHHLITLVGRICS